jgi:hypothetical protein
MILHPKNIVFHHILGKKNKNQNTNIEAQIEGVDEDALRQGLHI